MMILAHEATIVEVIGSLENEYRDSGYSIGLEGISASIDEVFAHHTAGALMLGRLAFVSGNYAGRKEHARRAGYDVGLAGRYCDRPESIHRRFDRAFTEGWQRGADEWAEREAILREDDAQEWAQWFEREHAERDAEARFTEAEIAEARGYFSSGSDKGGHDR